MTVYRYGVRHKPEMIADLSRRAFEYSAQVLRMVYERKSGHIGGAFSIAEVLTALYFHQLRVDSSRPGWEDRDRLVFSKGHACAMLYTVLAHRGFFPVSELPTFRGLNSRLQGHPEPAKTPGVEVAAGPLGHGIAIGAGMALGARLAGSRRKVYVIVGDGELNSGVIWEGLMVAAKFGLDNLKVIVDYNGVQQTGSTAQVLPTEPIVEKLRSFNWHVIEIHGHGMTKFAVTLALLLPLAVAQEYKLGPDSMRQAGVPQGKVAKYSWTSRIYPGTTRDYWVYVPAQYQSSRAAALAVFQDGASFVAEDGAWRVPVVFDNLIQRGEIPVTIGVFINPGVLPPDHANRSFEYDAVTDRYSRFLLEEVLPQVTKDYNISKDPNDHAIGGSSSGGICAFTVAWERPDAFRRVLSFVGSFVNLRGGEIYSSLVRKTEPKPIRVFLQDGEKDLNIAAGNWFIGAHDMLSALEYGGYDVTHVWGVEAHNSKHGGAILPYALRWLWRGYPAPIAKPKGGGGERQWSVLLTSPGTDWEVVSQGHKAAHGLAVDKQGNVFFSDGDLIYKIGIDGVAGVFKKNPAGARVLAFGPDGRLYASQDGRERLVSYSMDGKETVVAEHINVNGLAITGRGEMYVTDAPHKRIWLLDAKGGRRVAQEGFSPISVLLSPDQAFLIVNDSSNRGIWWFQVRPDGALANGDSLYRLEVQDESTATGAAGMAMDSEDFLYVATTLGIQVFDPPGRVMAILQPPQSGGLSSLVFGGPQRDILYVTSGDKVFKRAMTPRSKP